VDQTVSISLYNIYPLYLITFTQFFFSFLFLSWKHFEEKYVCWLLMNSDARKHNDNIFGAFHKLNLEDAKKYVTAVRAKLLIQHIPSIVLMFNLLAKCSVPFLDIQ